MGIVHSSTSLKQSKAARPQPDEITALSTFNGLPAAKRCRGQWGKITQVTGDFLNIVNVHIRLGISLSFVDKPLHRHLSDRGLMLYISRWLNTTLSVLANSVMSV